MDNQHRMIKGYRELSNEEIALMNRVKEKGKELGELCKELQTYETKQALTVNQFDDANLRRAIEAKDMLNSGIMDLKTGLMKITRAIAKPDFF